MTSIPSQRLLSLDVARGLTIAFMILVNDAGDGNHIYTQLEHARWSGWTLTDLVFPTFLFLMGVSLIFSLQSRIAKGESRRTLALHIARRALILFLLGQFIAAFPHFHWTHLRIFGVLTRIAVCYFFAGLICLGTRRIAPLAIISAVLLVGYWILLRFVPVPSFGVPTHDIPFLDPARNLACVIDRAFIAFTQRTIHTGRLYNNGVRDPEGLLSTLPSIATVLLGAITGIFMRMATFTQTQKRNLMATAGLVSLVVGLIWGLTFPINKNLWTSSYALFAAGCSLLGLTVCYWLIDILHLQDRSPAFRASLWPWLVFGSNAIVVYSISDLLVEIGDAIPIATNGTHTTLWGWIYTHLFAFHQSTNNTSLAFAIAFVLLCFLPNWLLWHKRIFVKI